jgi:hypothetical protein
MNSIEFSTNVIFVFSSTMPVSDSTKELFDRAASIVCLGHGLDSMVVERGRNFSVGQKQVGRTRDLPNNVNIVRCLVSKLFCLARALLRKAQVSQRQQQIIIRL